MIVFSYFIILIILLSIERIIPNGKIIRIIIPILYSFLIGFRNIEYGIDTAAYVDFYYYGGQFGTGFLEPGFDWINSFLFKLGFDANASFCVYAAITNFFFFMTLERLPKKDYTIPAFFLYWMTLSFLTNGMRQGVTVAAFLFAIRFIEEKKPLLYIITILLSSTIHYSAILLLPLYFARYISFSSKIIVPLYIITLIIGLTVDLSFLIPNVSLSEGRGDYSRYAENVRYIENSYLGFAVESFIIALTLFFIFKKRINNTAPVLSNFAFLAFILHNIAFFQLIAGRIEIYFKWVPYLIYPLIFNVNKNNKSYVIPFKYKFVFILLWLSIILNEMIKGKLDYHFYWENISYF